MRRFRLPFRLKSTSSEHMVPGSAHARVVGAVHGLVALRRAAAIAVVALAAAGCLSGIALSAGQHRRMRLSAGRPVRIPPPPLSFFRRGEKPAQLTARQREQARRSRVSYRDLDAAASLKLARGSAGVLGLAARSFYQPLMLTKGERVVRFLNAHEALVREPSAPRAQRRSRAQPGRFLIAKSTLPLTIGKGSHARVVSLALRRVGGGLAPVAPLVPLTISADRTDFTSLGVSLTLKGGHPSAIRDLGHESFEASVLKDTDLVMQPLAVGGEQWLQLRSPAAPQTFRFALTLPVGARTERQQDGSVKITQGNSTLLFIPSASATDALGRPVRTSFTVAGSTLVLTVAHRLNRQITYPVSVDPIEIGTPCGVPHVQDPYNFIGSECGQGTSTFEGTGPGSTADSWSQWVYEPLPGLQSPGPAMSHPVGSGVYMYTTPGVNYPAGDYGELVYQAPPGAFIQRVDFENTQHALSGVGGPASSFYWEGIYNDSGGGWEPETVTNAKGASTYLGAAPYTNLYPDGGGDWYLTVGSTGQPQNPLDIPPMSTLNGTNGNAAVFGLVLNTAGPRSSPDLAYMQGATVWLYDFNPPVISPASIPPSSGAWTDDSASPNHTISPVVGENGLGLKYLNLVINSIPDPTGVETSQGITNPCTGDHTGNGYCPKNMGPSSAYQWPISPFTYTLPEGQQQVTVDAGSAMDYNAYASFTAKIDRTAPTLTLNGSLYAARVDNSGGSSQASPLTGLSYPLQINASDIASPGVLASGIAEVDISVNNGPTTVLQGNCISGTGPNSGCEQSSTFNYNFYPANYPAGLNTIVVTTKDCLGAGLPATSTTASVCGGVPLATHVSQSQTFQVWTLPAASIGTPPTNAQNETLGLEKYYDYRTVQTGAGSTANVNLATGNLVWSDVLVTDPGQGLSTFAQVTYNSQQRLSDLNILGSTAGSGYDQIGQGFSLGIDGLTRLNDPLDLSQMSNGQISFTDIDGTHHTFVSENGQWIAPPGVFLHLRAWYPAPYTSSTWNKAWAITRPDGVTFFFDGLGYESSIQDRNGNTITFQRSYTALGLLSGAVGTAVCSGSSALPVVTTLLGAGCSERVTDVFDQNGRDMQVSYFPSSAPTGPGLVSSIGDHAGHLLAFTYDSLDDLKTMTASSGGVLPREFSFGYGGSGDATPAASSVSALGGLLGSLTGLSVFQQGLTSISDPRVNALGSGRPTMISYAATPGACPAPTFATGLAGLLNVEPKCATQITARDGGDTVFTYNEQTQSGPPNPGCATGALECTMATGPQTDQIGNEENWTDSFDTALRAFQQVDPLGRETLTSWNNPTQGSSGGICTPAQSASGCESGPGNTIASTTNGMIVPGYATDPTATTKPSPTVTQYSYDPNGMTTEQQGPANISAGESQTFRDVKTTYLESAGTLLAPSGADATNCPSGGVSYPPATATGCFVADETQQQVQRAAGTETTTYTLDLSNPADGLVTSVKDADGQTWQTKYYPAGASDGGVSGLIEDEIDPLGNDTHYGTTTLANDGYDPNGLPEQITAPGQSTPSTYQYDADGNLIAQTDPRNANPASLKGQQPSSATATASYTTYHAYNDLNDQTDEWVPKNSANGVFIHQSTTYDANGNVTSQSDGNARTTSSTYTPMDQLATKSSPPVQDSGEQSAAPEVTSYCYDLNEDQTYEVLPAGQPAGCSGTSVPINHATESVYDADGEPLVQEQISSTPGTQDQITSYAYDARGNQVGSADSADNAGAKNAIAETNAASALSGTAGPWRTRTVYDSANEPIEVDTNPSRSDGLIYRALSQYDAAGNLLATESAKKADSNTANANQTINAGTGEYAFASQSGMTSYTYDARNLLTSETDPQNDLTEYARQADGKICAVIAPDGTALGAPTTDDCTTPGAYKTTYSYYPEGWLQKIALPIAPGEYAYNAPLNVTYTRDAVGNPQFIVDPNGATITNTFYDTGDLETTSAPWWWTYDPQGTGTPGPDPNTGESGQVTSDTPDAGLQIREKTLQEIYQDDANNATPPTLPSDGTSGGFGDVPAQPLPGILPNAGPTSFAYDSDMQLSSVVDAQGSIGTTTLSYDPVNRLAQIRQPFNGSQTSTTSYTYDQDGNVASTTTPAVATLTGSGAPVSGNAGSAQAVAQTTTNTYDGLDRLYQTVAPGASSSQNSNSRSPFSSVPTQTTTYCYYLAPTQGTASVGTGATACPLAPTPGGTPATVAAPGGVSTTVAERVQTIDPGQNASDIDYDALGNELSSTDPLGNMTSYAYDELGDQTAVTRPAGQNSASGPVAGYTTTTSYDLDGRHTASSDGSANQTTYSYDSDGNLLTESNPGAASSPSGAPVPQQTAYTYNGRGLQWSATTGTGSDARTTVTETDGDGNPVRTVNPAGVSSSGSPYYAYTQNYTSSPGIMGGNPDNSSAANTDANLDATIRAYDTSNMLRAVYLPFGCNQTANATKASCIPQQATGQAFNSGQNDDTRRFAETFGQSSDGMDRVGSVAQAYNWNTQGASNYTTIYSYLPSGWLAEATGPQLDDKSQQMTAYTYDPAGDQTGALTTGTPPPPATQVLRNLQRSYWPDGQPQQVDGKSNTAIEHSYNYYYQPAGQLSELDSPSPIDLSAAPAETDSMCYDPAGRLTRVNETFMPGAADTGLDTAQTYDADGNLSTRSTNGYLGTASGSQTSCPTAAQAQSSTPPPYTGGEQTTFAYNNLDQETTMKVASTSAGVQPTRTYSTTYWPSGQKQTQTRQQGNGPTINEQWFYNDNGQESEDVNPSETVNSSGATKDQLYTYDTDGNLTQSENGSHLYNALDQEVLWTRGGPYTPYSGSTVNYVHDGDGALIEQIANTTQLNATIAGVGVGTVQQQTATQDCSEGTAGQLGQAPTGFCHLDAGRPESAATTVTTTITVPGITIPVSTGYSTVHSCYDAYGDLVQTVTQTATQNNTCVTRAGQLNAATTTTYGYNAFGQTETTTTPTSPAPAVTDTYLYDALGRRFQKAETPSGGSTNTTHYGYVGLTDLVSQDTDATTGTTLHTNSYDYDSSGDRVGLYTSTLSGGNYYSYATDIDGSVEGLEGSDGKVDDGLLNSGLVNGKPVYNRYHYTPYGNLELGSDQNATLLSPPSISGTLSQDAQANDFLFEGFQYDSATNTYALPARTYQPTSGSYTTPDQFESASSNQTLQTDPGTQDPYAYASGSPTSQIEIDGHAGCDANGICHGAGAIIKVCSLNGECEPTGVGLNGKRTPPAQLRTEKANDAQRNAVISQAEGDEAAADQQLINANRSNPSCGALCSLGNFLGGAAGTLENGISTSASLLPDLGKCLYLGPQGLSGCGEIGRRVGQNVGADISDPALLLGQCAHLGPASSNGSCLTTLLEFYAGAHGADSLAGSLADAGDDGGRLAGLARSPELGAGMVEHVGGMLPSPAGTQIGSLAGWFVRVGPANAAAGATGVLVDASQLLFDSSTVTKALVQKMMENLTNAP
jgi:RHS repeat-associated protein